jgi:hypothetical protein
MGCSAARDCWKASKHQEGHSNETAICTLNERTHGLAISADCVAVFVPAVIFIS